MRLIGRPIPRWLSIALGVLSIFIVIGAYELLSIRQTSVNPKQTVVPGISSLAKGVVKVLKAQGTSENPKPSWFWEDFRATYWRLLVGVSLGVIGSLIVGIAIGAYSPVDAFLTPMITFMAKIPPTAMLAVYMILFGTNLWAYTAIVSLGIFFSMVQSIAQAVQTDVEPDHIDKAYTLGASEAEVIFEVLWRQILPRFIDNVRLQIGPGMIYLIAAEAVFGGDGFGYRIKQESRLSNMNVVYPYLAFLGASGLLFDWILIRLRKFICPWFGDSK